MVGKGGEAEWLVCSQIPAQSDLTSSHAAKCASNSKSALAIIAQGPDSSYVTALRYFLVDRERTRFCFNDFTLSHWP